MQQIHNFSAGPSILPKEAMEAAIEGLRDFKGMGLSVVEISHRSPQWEETMHDMRELIKRLYSIPEGYHIIFLGGGASMQFTQIPQNLLGEGKTAAYLKTGTWAANAAKEAKFWGNANVVADSEADNYTHIPKGYTVPADSAYFHITTNNTIYGTEMHEIPKVPVPIVADMSSDVFSRPIDISQYGLIYAGAQKNMGPAGVTMLIIRDDMVNLAKREMPTMMNYATHIKGESMYNTPPVFPIYMSHLTLQWLEKQGGVEGMYARNSRKGDILYTEVDRNTLFKGTTAVEDRSLMNATFVCNDAAHEKAFLSFAEANGIYGLKGHRSVGGFRASMYNALPESSVAYLVELMQAFEKQNG